MATTPAGAPATAASPRQSSSVTGAPQQQRQHQQRQQQQRQQYGDGASTDLPPRGWSGIPGLHPVQREVQNVGGRRRIGRQHGEGDRTIDSEEETARGGARYDRNGATSGAGSRYADEEIRSDRDMFTSMLRTLEQQMDRFLKTITNMFEVIMCTVGTFPTMRGGAGGVPACVPGVIV